MSDATAVERHGPDDLGSLPEWDLSDLYPAPDSAELARDLTESAAAAADFARHYQGKLAGLAGAELAGAIAEYERIAETLGRLESYAGLRHAADMTDPTISRQAQDMREKVTDISARTLFFTLELNRLEDERLAELLATPSLERYRPWLRDIRAFRPHQLSDEAERLIHERSVAGRQAWIRLFDETLAALRFPFGGKELNNAEVLHLLSDKDEAKRREAAKSLAKVLGENVRLFALVTNTLAKDKEIEDRWRRFATPAASRHLANHLEAEVVAALVSAVEAAYPRLSHRYYRIKARWLGKEKLEYWDRNAPLPEDDDREIPWTEARKCVLGAYNDFSPELAGVVRRFFERAWIDAPVRPGKEAGAFCHPTVTNAHPYVLLNYQGKTRDVMTLAHELGHGAHQMLAAGRGYLMSDTPLTLAETASVFGEMLTFQALLRGEGEKRRRRVMIAAKVEDMLNTVVRQIAFYDFERMLHAERRAGELTAERIGEIWMEVQRKSLGDAFRFEDEYKLYWSYIPHFIHAPFYVYAYAFGDCLVNSLYAVYERAEPGFQERYLVMLRAGGTLHHKELLAPFGLDASDPGFWAKGLALIERFIGELEATL
ncbi:MAG TPA: M3 family oligoendopeptidase [Alphaproteobacteria bacterium]|nr:M3 family oligoendopeptidase [Alphaproteobacteria bacterium]